MQEPKNKPSRAHEKQLVALKKYGLAESGALEIAKPLAAIEENVPRLNEEDIDRIAAKVANLVAENLRHDKSKFGGETWRTQLKGVAKELAVGVLGSGVYELIVYLSTKVWHAAGPEQQTPSMRTKERAVRLKLLRGLSDDDRRDFDDYAEPLLRVFQQEFNRRWQKRIAETAPFKEVIEDNESRDRSIGLTIQPRLSGNPLEAEIVQDDLFYVLNEYIYSKVLDNGSVEPRRIE